MSNLEMTFRDESDQLLVIMPDVVETLLRHRQVAQASKEAAGVLIGERRGPHLVIRRISEPGPGDKRSTHSVDRCGSHHQVAVDKAFEQSDGTLHYLGEWHTHPEDFPSPSSLDRSSWRKKLISREPNVLIIVGRKRIWTGKKIGKKIITLVEV
jgi:integrative and conjugative element protein (TIGR02256 family)